MTWRLKTYIYQAFMGRWDDITDMVRGPVIRCDLHGGVQTIEFQIADDYIDAYRWAYEHIGSKVYILDNACSPPVAEGELFEPGISEDGNRITVFGPWLAYMYKQVFNKPGAWVDPNTGAQLKEILTTDCPDVSSDQDNIDEPGSNNADWHPTDEAFPGDHVDFLAALSDVNNAEWYFWLQSAPLKNMASAAPIPWFKTAANIPGLYTCWRKDMAPGGLDLTPSLRDLVNDARVIYRDSAGTQQQTGSATDADSQARYGLREQWAYDLGPATAALANQYRDLLIARFKDPQQAAGFRLNSWAYDEHGGRWPLWRVIADFPVTFTVNDLIPDNTVLAHMLDNKRSFITLAAEYDYETNTLTIVPDTEDNRADVMLARHRAFQ